MEGGIASQRGIQYYCYSFEIFGVVIMDLGVVYAFLLAALLIDTPQSCSFCELQLCCICCVAALPSLMTE